MKRFEIKSSLSSGLFNKYELKKRTGSFNINLLVV